MIVANLLMPAGGIINPWMAKNIDDDDNDYYGYGQVFDTDLNVLVVNKALRKMGMEMLWERIVFHFSRLCTAVPVTPGEKVYHTFFLYSWLRVSSIALETTQEDNVYLDDSESEYF